MNHKPARGLLFVFIITALAFARESGARYLIITHDNYYTDILPLAEWKNRKGLLTKVVKMSETGSTASQIRAYILNAYNNWPVPPEYLLLVGAPNYLPFPQVSGTYSDNYYTNLDGDIYNEILSGRLTVHSSSECQTVVNKIMAYERTPDLAGDSTWFIDGCLVIRLDGSNPSDSIYWSDIEFAAGAMSSAGFREIDTLCSAWGNNANDIINSVNNGCGFLLYRGQGVNNWWSPFSVNPDQTANGNRLPIVLSFTCSTIGTGSTPATAERWFLTGSPSTLRGGAGYFATTTVITGGAHLRSAVCKGFIKEVFNGTWPVFGRACEKGRADVYSLYPSGGDREYYGFTTIGDPSMNLWTAIPRRISVHHDSLLHVGADSLTVTVTQNTAPVESAYVCVLMDTSIYETGYTTTNGQITFAVQPDHPGVISLTVTGHNLYPYEADVPVTDTSAYLIPAWHWLNDSLGNRDSLPGPGETILLMIKVRNLGPSSARSVWAVLHLTDTLAFVIDSTVHLGNVPANDSALGANPFVLAISPMAPDNHLLACRITLKNAEGDTWPAMLPLTISDRQGVIGPDPYGYYLYDDTDTLTNMAPVFEWQEIAPSAGGPGNLVEEITNEDADTVTYPLPFSFPFYGQSYNTIGLCSNGFAEFSTSTYRFGANTMLPTVGGPRRLVAPFWDDLAPNLNGDIVYFHDTLNHCWRLEFKDCAHYDNYGNQETFQLVLRDPAYYPTPTGDGEILIYYDSVADASSNTVGIEDETETRAIQYVFNDNYDPAAVLIISGRALRITTLAPDSGRPSPWLYCARLVMRDSTGGNNNGMLEPGETATITVTAANGGDTTAYQTRALLSTTDPDGFVTDSLAFFDDIEPGDTVSNSRDPFLLTAAQTPGDSMIELFIRFDAENVHAPAWAFYTLHLYRADPVTEITFKLPSTLTELTVKPNPFRNWTIININQNAHNIKLSIYDVSGRRRRSFFIPRHSAAGPQAIFWDGTDQKGHPVPAGVYFVQVEAHATCQTKKVIRLE